MDFTDFFQAQASFDLSFQKVSIGERIKKKLLAIIVELGEAANEAPEAGFKYWSANPKASSVKMAEYYAEQYQMPVIQPTKDSLLEEIVDKFHFILSIGNEFGFSERVGAQIDTGHAVYDDITDLFLKFTGSVVGLYNMWELSNRVKKIIDPDSVFHSYLKVFAYFLAIVAELGYTTKQLEAAYYEKNQINYQRQENGY